MDVDVDINASDVDEDAVNESEIVGAQDDDNGADEDDGTGADADVDTGD